MYQVKDQRAEKTVSDAELLQVMADFLNMGHVENIVAMYRQDRRYYDWTGDLLTDERFAVRLGVSVLFEYLIEDGPDGVALAVPSLVRQLGNEKSWVRGEAVSVLGIIGSREALAWVKTMTGDPDDQVVEVARDILQQAGETY
ncbi:MAG TPA: HEAT repeat domain-containing protein [Desulfobulbaceae bacterium]|nr:HEAT repeat domain-containing protein [Desulfobulbaceae bacterium]